MIEITKELKGLSMIANFMKHKGHKPYQLNNRHVWYGNRVSQILHFYEGQSTSNKGRGQEGEHNLFVVGDVAYRKSVWIY